MPKITPSAVLLYSIRHGIPKNEARRVLTGLALLAMIETARGVDELKPVLAALVKELFPSEPMEREE